MKTRSQKSNVDPKVHVRKKTAGMASGAIIGATVAGPIGALVGGAIGTFIGDAAEDGARLPKQVTDRIKKPMLRSTSKAKVKTTKKRSTTASAKTKARPTKKVATSRPTKKKK